MTKSSQPFHSSSTSKIKKIQGSKDYDLSLPLKGKDLLDFIEKHRDTLSDNGDSLCIGAGYGELAKDGSATCRLDLFGKELIKAKEEEQLSNIGNHARKSILNSYTKKELNLIAEFGCITGKAFRHLQVEETEKFFDQNQNEIVAILETQFGDGYVEKSKKRVGGDNVHWKHRAVWRFIEIIAGESIN